MRAEGGRSSHRGGGSSHSRVEIQTPFPPESGAHRWLSRYRVVAKWHLQNVGEMQSVVKKKNFLNTLALDSQVKVLFLKDGAPKAGGDRTR